MALALDPRFVVELSGHADEGALAEVYRRRRVVVALLALMLVLGGVFAAGRAMASGGGVPASVPTAQPVQSEPYIVQPGDTLWSIAGRFHGSDSLAGYVEALVRANQGPDIAIGQRLLLPAG